MNHLQVANLEDKTNI